MKVLYEDKDIIVAVKPVGVESQAAKTFSRDMVSLIKNYLYDGKKQAYVGVVHRLDKPVGGVMVFAKNKKAAADLSRQIAERKIRKRYRAIVYADIKDEYAELEDYILKDKNSNISRIVPESTPDAKLAKLSFKVIKRDVLCRLSTLIEIELKTGRHHQIRAQLSHHDMPIVGDRKYNSLYMQEGYDKALDTGLKLCSYALEFELPSNKKRIRFSLEENTWS